jgi:hypothetical protein
MIETKDYITLIEVNWRLHFALEVYLAGPGTPGRV